MGALEELAQGQDLEVWAVERRVTPSLSFLSGKKVSMHRMIGVNEFKVSVHRPQATWFRTTEREAGWEEAPSPQEESGELRTSSRSQTQHHPSGVQGKRKETLSPHGQQKSAPFLSLAPGLQGGPGRESILHLHPQKHRRGSQNCFVITDKTPQICKHSCTLQLSFPE